MTTIDDSFISDEEEEYCPLCVEEMDISDKNFKPCPCGYQICQFCYNNIKQIPELNGRCPGCRRLYDDNSVEYKTITPEEYKLQQLKREKREREKKQREKEKKESELASKKHLAGIRVVQKNLVYVTGLNPPCNPEDLHSVLRSDRYFGRYGKILKIVINKKTPTPSSTNHHHQNPGLVVYVTFSKKEDALKCINDMDGSLLDGRVLRAAHGTTKYCSSYLRGHPCQNPNCMFLHEPGEEADSFTRKDLSTQQGIKMGMMGAGGGTRTSSSSANVDALHNQQSQDATTSGPTSNNGSVTNDEDEKDKDGSAAPLPPTAHWAKSNNSNTSSPAVNNNASLANASAFPTLSEIFKEQKHSQQAPSQSKVLKSKKKKEFMDDSDTESDSPVQFLGSLTDSLKHITQKKEPLSVKFSKEFEDINDSDGNILPLFQFNKSVPNNRINIDQEKLLAKRVIETYLMKPIKNYHLAYANHPIIQQQILLQQQQQQQQQTQKVPPPSIDSNLQQQQQQLMLLQQLQRQQQQAQQQTQNTPGSATVVPAQIQPQMGTPQGQQVPLQQPHPPHPQQQPLQQQPQMPPQTGAGAPPGLGGNSSSSQLLTQLMSGKR